MYEVLNRPQPLAFSVDGNFQISIFGDLHYGENAWEHWGPQQDVWSQHVMDRILDAERTQLVVLNGDLITGENAFLENSTKYVDQIVAPMVKRGLPWASTYGNHDSQYNLSRDDILAREYRWSNARTKKMVFNPNAGVSNYYLLIYPNDCQRRGCIPRLILWFFDSRGGALFQELNKDGSQITQPNWVDQSVVEWFKSASQRLKHKHGVIIPSLAFVHIPTNASRAIQTDLGVDPRKSPGINDDYPLAQQAQGWCKDGSNSAGCDYGGQDVPFVQALVATPGLMALFSGHDHGDSWCYKWRSALPGSQVEPNGINLCFGQHSGYGGYGSWIRGSRQLLITEKMLQHYEIETWIRLEDQSRVGHVTLNATYGEDIYPKTSNRHTHCPTC
ncbi:Metallo-dependent phosphatase [Polychaeton citri CBS 116435]|uniref:Metallo-dependent phosphatase n=1 Tax=Polychaeton citri CBS 116435 TaxID=1314669 RepID=A0A9P4UI60_9PEZI|nr:Metallo-dependent phosphatase [Polychaeton citri CBS 116435]